MLWMCVPKAALPTGTNSRERQRDLESLREEYDFSLATAVPDAVVAKSLPWAERPALGWLLKVVVVLVRSTLRLLGSTRFLRSIADAAEEGSGIPTFTRSHQPSASERVELISSVTSSTLAVASHYWKPFRKNTPNVKERNMQSGSRIISSQH